jgi:hypothetical protein
MYSSALSLISALVNATPQLLYAWERDPIPFVQEIYPDFCRLFIFGFYSFFDNILYIVTCLCLVSDFRVEEMATVLLIEQ